MAPTCVPGAATVAETTADSTPLISFCATVSVGSRKALPEPRYWPSTAPTRVCVLPPTVKVAANSRQPPAESVEPVLMPMTPSSPTSLL
jgi:hypothetical protein